MKVLVIGAGNMGLTYSEGMSNSALLGKHNLKIYDTDPKKIKTLNKQPQFDVYDNLEEWNIESNDIDADGVCNNLDNCPEVFNPLQEDFNFDNIGDACDGLYINEGQMKRELIKVIDVLGRVGLEKGFQFEIYNDGSVEKKYVLE